MGHSLGGYTVLGLAGGLAANGAIRASRRCWRWRPFPLPFVDKDMLGKITVPVMYISGTKDRLISAAAGGAKLRHDVERPNTW